MSLTLAPSQLAAMKVRIFSFFALFRLLTVVHSAPSNILAQEEVYREAVTDGFVIDNFYLNLFTTESSKTHGAAQPSQQLSLKEEDIYEASGGTSKEAETFSVLQYGGKATTATPRVWTEQPSLESEESDLLEGSGYTTITSVFPRHHVSTTASVSPDWGTQQSKESELLEGSGYNTITSVIPQHHVSTTASVSPDWSTQQPSPRPKHGHKPDVSTTASVSHTQSPSTTVLPGDVEGSDSEIVKSAELQNLGDAPPVSKEQTPGWIIILAFIVGIAALIMVCIAIATRDKWNASNKAPSPDSESKIKSINQQKDLEMENFLHKDQPTENRWVTEYTVIPLDELPEKYSSD